jgi:hypothetical protein
MVTLGLTSTLVLHTCFLKASMFKPLVEIKALQDLADFQGLLPFLRHGGLAYN